MTAIRFFSWLCGAILIALAAAAPARADLRFPSFTNYVVDEANVMPGVEEEALVAKLKGFQERTGHQLVVATVPSLQGTSVEDFGNRLFRAWKIGDASRNDGALLLVAPVERKVRIEVGYGLEGDLTDAVSRLIIENAILPRFRAGDYGGGIVRGADDVMAVFLGQADEYKARAASQADDGPPPIAMIVMGLFLLLFLYNFIRSLRSGGGRRRRSAPWIIGGPGFGGGGGGWSGGGGFSGGGGGSSGGGGASGGW